MSKSKFLLKCVAFGALSFGSLGHASTFTGVKITYIIAGTGSTDHAYVYFAVTNPNPCSTGRYIFDANTDAGEAVLALLQEAQAAGKTINVTGTGSCSINGNATDSEGVNYIVVNS